MKLHSKRSQFYEVELKNSNILVPYFDNIFRSSQLDSVVWRRNANDARNWFYLSLSFTQTFEKTHLSMRFNIL